MQAVLTPKLTPAWLAWSCMLTSMAPPFRSYQIEWVGQFRTTLVRSNRILALTTVPMAVPSAVPTAFCRWRLLALHEGPVQLAATKHAGCGEGRANFAAPTVPCLGMLLGQAWLRLATVPATRFANWLDAGICPSRTRRRRCAGR